MDDATSGRLDPVSAFQEWGGEWGSLPRGWTLKMEIDGRATRISTDQLNKPQVTSENQGCLMVVLSLIGMATLIFIIGIVFILAAVAYPITVRHQNRIRFAYWGARHRVKITEAIPSNSAEPISQ